MLRGRLFYVLISLALLILAALTIRTAIATSAVVAVSHDPYDEVERNRTLISFAGAGDFSYDEVERIRARRDSLQGADFSYDGVEGNRSHFLSGASQDRSVVVPDLFDYALRHPGARIVTQSAPDLSDYWQRHPEVSHPAAAPDRSDYWQRYPEVAHPAAAPDLSDWFQRHPDIIAAILKHM